MKNWMIRNFLPMWAKETVLADNRSLQLQNRKLKQLLREREAYIRGLELGLRAVRSKRKETI